MTEQRGADVNAAVIARTLLDLLDRQQAGATVCPSEVARALRPTGDWRALMPRVREVAHALAQQGKVEATRAGSKVDALASGGPIRLRAPTSGATTREAWRTTQVQTGASPRRIWPGRHQ